MKVDSEVKVKMGKTWYALSGVAVGANLLAAVNTWVGTGDVVEGFLSFVIALLLAGIFFYQYLMTQATALINVLSQTNEDLLNLNKDILLVVERNLDERGL